MKYNIIINQKAVYDAGLIGKVDLVDLALFDFIYNLFNSDFEGKITFKKGGKTYVEITAALINAQMPLLEMSKRSFIRRMGSLIKLELVERYEGNQKENRSAFSKGVKWNIFDLAQPTPKMADPTPNKAEGYAKNGTRPTPKMARNNNIDDNNIIYNKREKEKIRLPSKSGVLDLDLESCKSVLMENQSWKETVVMNLQSGGFPMFAMEDLETNLDFFFKKLANEGVTEKSPKDAMAHFSRWLNIELKNANQKHITTKQEANDYAMQQFIKYCQSTDDSWTPGPDKPF